MEILAAIVIAIAAVVAAFIKGKATGKTEATKDVQVKVLDEISKAKDIEEAVAGLPADERRERLRKYSK